MLLLYPGCRRKVEHSWQFTFHYASTLSSAFSLPLYAFFNLHSTMLLLYRAAGHPDCVLSWFTFHYASTLSEHVLFRYTSYNEFTFHYASTLSEKTAPWKLRIPNLHSTMLLLYRGHALVEIHDSAFTFHYASTLSDIWNLRGKSVPNLHSTMLLLYRNYRGIFSSGISIYIPLCFYFISHSDVWCEWGNCIYIPLCFYFIQAQGHAQSHYLHLHSTMLLLYLLS